MRDDNIRIEPFELLSLLTFSGKQEVNEHGVISFSGVISDQKENEYLGLALNGTWVKITIVDSGQNTESWFCGIITKLDITSEDGLKILSVTLHTGSYLMDTKLHTRSYQSESITYDSVLSSYTGDYHKSDIMMYSGKGTAIGTLIMQYRETDWAFTKRLASHFNAVVLPESRIEGVKYYFGISGSSAGEAIKTGTYKAMKNMHEYQTKKNRGVELLETDAMYYILRSRDVYRLGSNISFNSKSLYISRIDTQLEGSELYHTYYMKSLNGFKVPRVHNTEAIGASFDATILAVEKDVVKIKVSSDENAGGCGERWFPYSTVYSSPDGTGWYCMPETGDSVRMYIPGENEAEAYVISSTHLESSDTQERANPDYKSIMNKQKKEVLFTPDSLIFTNNNGMSVELLDNEGIKIISNKAIIFESDEAINIASTQSTVTVAAPEAVVFKQGDTVTQLQENVTFGGAQVHLD